MMRSGHSRKIGLDWTEFLINADFPNFRYEKYVKFIPAKPVHEVPLPLPIRPRAKE